MWIELKDEKYSEDQNFTYILENYFTISKTRKFKNP
jgi:hypothetical protein